MDPTYFLKKKSTVKYADDDDDGGNDNLITFIHLYASFCHGKAIKKRFNIIKIGVSFSNNDVSQKSAAIMQC